MTKSSPLLVPLMLLAFPLLLLANPSCAGGETAGGTGNSSGSGNTSGTGNRPGSGGSIGFNSGGSTGFNSGGFTGFNSGGATGFTSGGSTGFTSGGATGIPGSGGAPVPPGALQVTGGFASNGTWTGYAYTATFPAAGAATISPVCPTPCFAPTNTQLCATVSIAAEPLMVGASGAILGWTIHQALATSATPPPIMNIAPTLTGIAISLSASVPGGRVQLQDTNGNQWCFQVNPAGTPLTTMNIPWASFSSRCYSPTDPLNVAYTKQPISAISIVVPSATMAIGPLNFCLSDAHEY